MQDESPTWEHAERAQNADAPCEVFGDRDPDQLASWFVGEGRVNAITETQEADPAPPLPSSTDVREDESDSRNDSVPKLSLRECYGLREEPFGITPDPAYLYDSKTHSEALDLLFAGIRENRGFLALIAEPGMGKTTLLFQLLQDLRDSARTVFLFQTQCGPEEFVRYILHGLDIETHGMDLVAMHDKLNEVLFQEMLAGKRFVLVVDEAQNLDDSVLETVRMLSNYEAHHTKLIQIVLTGQPQLAAKLAEPQLLQLRQRISVLAHLEPLAEQDVSAYIAHRLTVAGYQGEGLFESDAVALITHHSHGIPRNINNLCYHALAIAHTTGCPTITAAVVQAAAERLDISSLIPPRLTVDGKASAARSGGLFARSLAADAGPFGPSLFGNRENSELTYKSRKLFTLPRWPFRAAALAAILIVGSAFLAILEHGRQTQASAGADHAASRAQSSSPAANAPAFSADPQTTGTTQVITVVAKPNQSLQDICLLYASHYDPNLVEEIHALNPAVDLNRLTPGQLLQIPLPPGTLKPAN